MKAQILPMIFVIAVFGLLMYAVVAMADTDVRSSLTVTIVVP